MRIFNMDSIWVQYEFKMDSMWIQYGFNMESRWIQDWIQDWIQQGGVPGGARSLATASRSEFVRLGTNPFSPNGFISKEKWYIC